MSFMADSCKEVRAWVQGKPEIVVTVEDLQWTGENSGVIRLSFRSRWYLLESVYPAGVQQIHGRTLPRLSTEIPPFNLVVDTGGSLVEIRGLLITEQRGANFAHQTTVDLLFQCTEVRSDFPNPSP